MTVELCIYEDFIFSTNALKSFQRLGGNKKISSAQKWKLKKTGGDGSENGSQNMSNFLKLTELANKIIETGNMDIYQETYEMIKLKVQATTTH